MPTRNKANSRLADDEEPPPGAHLITPRRGYLHHGIYVGAGRVVHYSARAFSLIRHPVEEVSMGVFSRGRGIWTSEPAPSSHEAVEIIRRARSRIGENRYRLLTNNCEHFCEWCVRDEHRSSQVEGLLALPMRVWKAPAHLLSALLRTSAHFTAALRFDSSTHSWRA